MLISEMLLEDLVSVQPTLSSIAPPAHPSDHIAMPNYSYGLPPPTMQCDPPPVTRLLPENLLTAIPGVTPMFEVKSLICSETESESAFSSSVERRAEHLDQNLPNSHALSKLLSSNPAPIRPSPCLTNPAVPSIGDYRSSSTSNKFQFHIPLKITIPTKVRLPPRKDGKQSNKHTYKPHGPGDGLLKIADQPSVGDRPPSVGLHPLDLRRDTMPNPQGMTKVHNEFGIFNVISTCEPGSRVPTPPASLISDSSMSTSNSTSSVTKVLTSSSIEDQTRAAPMLPSMTFPTAMMTNTGTKPRKSRAKGGSAKKRTSFTRAQLDAMERRFEKQRYLTSIERQEFAISIGLEDNQVKVWYQNRRSKLKRHGEVSSTSNMKPRPRSQPPINPAHLPHKQQMTPAMMDMTSSSAALHPAYCISGPTSYQPPHCNMSSQLPTNSLSTANQTSVQMTQAESNPHTISNMTTVSSTPSIPAAYAGSATNPYGPMLNMASIPPPNANYSHSYAPSVPDFAQAAFSSAPTSSFALPSGFAPSQSYPTYTSTPSTTSNAYVNSSYAYAYDPSHVNAHSAQASRAISPFAHPYSPVIGCHVENAWTGVASQMPILSNVNYAV